MANWIATLRRYDGMTGTHEDREVLIEGVGVEDAARIAMSLSPSEVYGGICVASTRLVSLRETEMRAHKGGTDAR